MKSKTSYIVILLSILTICSCAGFLETGNEIKDKIIDKLFLNPSSESIFCKKCQSYVSSINDKDYSKLYENLKNIAIEICDLAKMYKREVCIGGVEEMYKSVLDSLKYHYLDKNLICPTLRLCPEYYKYIDIDNLREEILSDKPKISQKPKEAKDDNENKKEKQDSFFILHISDVHTDLEYEEGTPSECDEPVCCRKESKATSDKKAGKWGSLAYCDLPSKTFDKFLDFLKRTGINIEFGLWTGDNTSHDIWHQSYERNEANTKYLTESLMKNINYTIYPCIGNHESFPVNVYDFLSDREKSFNSFFAEQWKQWIGQKSADQMKNYGYYSTFNEKYNLKIISLNTQACDSENWYLLKDSTDPGNMLDFLRKELKSSEEKGEKVYIISHYPNNSCLDKFGKIQDALHDRFSETIRGIFVGHSHGDGISFVRDSKSNQIIGTSLLTGSLTTYSNRNPSFRIIEVDKETLRPINFHQYRLDLEKANKNPEKEELDFEKVYSFLEEYEIKDMTHVGIHEFLNKLESDKITISKFKHHSDSKVGPIVIDQNLDLQPFCSTFNIPSQEDRCNNKKESALDKILNLARGQWKRVKITNENEN